jgi:hypothetical protein
MRSYVQWVDSMLSVAPGLCTAIPQLPFAHLRQVLVLQLLLSVIFGQLPFPRTSMVRWRVL